MSVTTKLVAGDTLYKLLGPGWATSYGGGPPKYYGDIDIADIENLDTRNSIVADSFEQPDPAERGEFYFGCSLCDSGTSDPPAHADGFTVAFDKGDTLESLTFTFEGVHNIWRWGFENDPLNNPLGGKGGISNGDFGYHYLYFKDVPTYNFHYPPHA